MNPHAGSGQSDARPLPGHAIHRHPAFKANSHTAKESTRGTTSGVAKGTPSGSHQRRSDCLSAADRDELPIYFEVKGLVSI